MVSEIYCPRGKKCPYRGTPGGRDMALLQAAWPAGPEPSVLQLSHCSPWHWSPMSLYSKRYSITQGWRVSHMKPFYLRVLSRLALLSIWAWTVVGCLTNSVLLIHRTTIIPPSEEIVIKMDNVSDVVIHHVQHSNPVNMPQYACQDCYIFISRIVYFWLPAAYTIAAMMWQVNYLNPKLKFQLRQLFFPSYKTAKYNITTFK